MAGPRLPTSEERWSSIVERLKELRNGVDAAEAALFRECRRVELSEKRLWSQFAVSFDGILVDHHICDSRRYRDFVAAEEALGPDVVDKIGPSSAILSFKIADAERRAKFVEAASKRFEEAGVHWSQQQAETQKKNIAGQSPKDSIYNKKVSRENELYQETVELKKKLAEMTKILKEKDEEIAKLKKKLAKA